MRSRGEPDFLLSRGVSVDRFSRKAKAYFVTHSHRDHVAGLGSNWSRGPIIASPLTARFLTAVLGVPPLFIQTIKAGESIELGAMRATAFDANHIPGSLMFGFEADGFRALHTGDMRAEPEVIRSVEKWSNVDILYLDATYGAHHYSFPSRSAAAETVANLARRSKADEIMIALYSAGRIPLIERLVAEFGSPFYVSEPIRKSYETLGLGSLVTADKESTRLRGYQRNYLETYFLQKRVFDPDRHLVIIPTGWTADAEPAHPEFHYVPYSDHSDYAELQAFISAVQPKRIIPIAGSV